MSLARTFTPHKDLPPLWDGDIAAETVKGENTASWQAFGVAIDNREVHPGDLFVALKGERHDGHKFIAKAFEAGAYAALVNHDADLSGLNSPLLKVPDTQEALVALGRAARARSKAKIIGVTGSVGKTGTKDALYHCFSRVGAAHVSVKSFNNEIGVPLTLARMVDWADYGVFEMGMNHAGELRALSAQVKPHVALITTVESAHAAHFENEEAIADAKAEILTGLEPGGVAVLNRDNRHFDRLADAARAAGVERILSFGFHEEADVRPLNVAMHADLSCIAADVCGQRLIYKIGLAGRHWVMNSLGILAAIQAAGGDLGLAGLALGELTPLPGRGRRLTIDVTGGSALMIDEAYNANPASMRSALAAMKNMPVEKPGKRIAVLGDMLELGENSDEIHADLADVIKDAGVTHLIVKGKHWGALAEKLSKDLALYQLEDNDQLLAHAKAHFKPNDLILAKGSNALGLGRFVEDLRDGKHLQRHPHQMMGEI